MSSMPKRDPKQLDVDVTGTPPPCPYCRERTRSWGYMTAHVLLCVFKPSNIDLTFAPLPRELSELQYQTIIDHCAKGLGYETCHVKRASFSNGRMVTPTSSRGFPDLWCVRQGNDERPGRLVVFEVKRQVGSKTYPEQIVWINALQSVVGVDAFIVKPYDWPHVIDFLME